MLSNILSRLAALEARSAQEILVSTCPGPTAEERLRAALATQAGTWGGFSIILDEPVTLTRPLVLDIAHLRIDFRGHPITSKVKQGPSIEVTNTLPRLEPMNTRRAEGLHLIGPGTAPGSVGVRFHTPDPTGTKNVRDLAFTGLVVEEFDTLLSFGKNSYLLSFHNSHFFKGNTLARVEDLGHDPALENTNYGENYRFFSCCFGNAKLCFYLGDNSLTDVNCFGCSFDLLQGGGQRVAEVRAGQLNLFGAHIELNGALEGPVISVGPGSAAEVRVFGGRIQHNNTPAATVEHLFESLNPHRSGGITLNGVTMHYTEATSGVLCTGPGPFRTSDLTYPSGSEGSGYAAMTTLTSWACNLLDDPGFTSPTNLDAQVLDPGATSRTSSPAMTITNEQGRLVLTRHGSGPGSFMISVPVEAGRHYAVGFRLAEVRLDDPASAVGKFRLRERFAAVLPGADPLGREQVTRTESRAEAAWDVGALVGEWKAFGPTYAGGRPVPSRAAPAWADRYQVVIPVTNLPAGKYVFDKLLITGA